MIRDDDFSDERTVPNLKLIFVANYCFFFFFFVLVSHILFSCVDAAVFFFFFSKREISRKNCKKKKVANWNHRSDLFESLVLSFGARWRRAQGNREAGSGDVVQNFLWRFESFMTAQTTIGTFFLTDV